MNKFVGRLVAVSIVAGCSTLGPRTELMPLPDNFSVTRDSYGQAFLDKATYEYPAPDGVVFTERVALCGVSNLSMDGFAAKQTTSWTGPATGNLYRFTQKDQIQEGQIIRFISESENVVLLSGRDLLDQSGVLSNLTGQQDMFRDTLQYDIEARLNGDTYSLVFSDLKRATHETPGYENQGFMPIGAWPGSRAELYTPMIDWAAKRLNDCIQS